MSELSSQSVEDAAAADAGTARSEFAQAADLEVLAAVKASWLGKSGRFKRHLKAVASLPAADRPTVGKRINEFARELESAFEAAREALSRVRADDPLDPTFDPTMPGRRREEGSLHVVTLVLDEIRAILTRLGFDEVTGPELEDAWHNFDALNIPPEHPARSRDDNFHVEGGRLLRSQTSTVQIRAMESTKPPLRVFAPGRVYRPDTVDARHLYAFHQVEGLMVGEGVSFADLKACLVSFARSMYGPQVVVRFRPSYFPFTEVSAELDLRCPGCEGRRSEVKCSVCGGEGWMEVLGCGMVHPNVLRAVGHDPEKYTGFAFGMGVERVAMRRHGLDDVRLLVENDVRFLAQFR